LLESSGLLTAPLGSKQYPEKSKFLSLRRGLKRIVAHYINKKSY
jgi:hypothetical protein